MLFSDEDEEAGDEAGLATQARRIHQRYPLREGDAGTIGSRWKSERSATTAAQRYQRLRPVRSLRQEVQSGRRGSAHSDLQAYARQEADASTEETLKKKSRRYLRLSPAFPRRKKIGPIVLPNKLASLFLNAFFPSSLSRRFTSVTFSSVSYARRDSFYFEIFACFTSNVETISQKVR